jgi:hypothetical protein
MGFVKGFISFFINGYFKEMDGYFGLINNEMTSQCSLPNRLPNHHIHQGILLILDTLGVFEIVHSRDVFS